MVAQIQCSYALLKAALGFPASFSCKEAAYGSSRNRCKCTILFAQESQTRGTWVCRFTHLSLPVMSPLSLDLWWWGRAVAKVVHSSVQSLTGSISWGSHFCESFCHHTVFALPIYQHFFPVPAFSFQCTHYPSSNIDANRSVSSAMAHSYR